MRAKPSAMCLVLVPVLIGVLASCGSASRPAPAPPHTVTSASPSTSPPPLDGCVQPGDRAHEVSFVSSGGEPLIGAELGVGTVGIVLAHMYMGSLCDWFPYADRLRDRGWRVLAFDFGGGSLVDAVAGAADELRREGATTIVLVGESMGGAAALAAASLVTPPVTAAAALSSPSTFRGADAAAAVPHLTMPVLFMDARDSPDFPADARAMYAACPSRHKELSLLPGTDHGAQLLQGSVAAQAQAVLETFIARSVAATWPPS